MKKTILTAFLFSSLLLNAQNDKPSTKDSLTISSPSSMLDSLNKATQDQIFKESMEQNSRNLDSFLAMRKEQEAKEKRNAMIRIGIGVLFLVVLVIGLRRRVKK